MTELKKTSFLKQSFNYLSTTFISNLINLVTLPLYTRFLDPSDYGMIALFLVFGTTVTSFLSLGLQSATFRYYFQKNDDEQTFRSLNFTNIIFVLLIFCSAIFPVYFLREWVSKTIFDGNISGRLLLLSFFCGTLEYFNSYFFFMLTAQGKAKAFGIITLGKSLLNNILSFYFIIFHSMTYMGRIHGLWISQLLVTLVLLYLCKNTLTPKISIPSLKKSLKFSMPQVPLGALGLVYSSFDKAMLSSYRGLTDVGYFNFGERFASLISLCIDSIDKAWSPLFLKKASEDTAKAKQEIVDRFCELAFVFMIGGMCIIYFSEELIRVLTTPEFYPAMFVVPVYAYYHIFGMTGKIAVNQLMYAEKLGYLAPSSIVSMVLNVLLNIILIKKWGAVGAATATAIASCGSSIVLIYYGHKAYPLPIRSAKLIGMFLFFMAFTAPIYPLMMWETGFFIKVFLKIVLIATFIYFGIKANYVALDQIKKYAERVVFLKSVLRKLTA